MASWPLFSVSTGARFFAAVVPFLNCARLLTYGLGFYSDEALVKSVTREGKREELLRGPLYYVIVLLIIVLVFWRDSPIGIVSLSMMSGGDGFADIIGRRFGSLKLPFNNKKSWVGSAAMFISGLLLSALMLFYFSWFGYIQVSWDQALGKLVLVALAATVVECIPVTDVVDDNISVPLASMIGDQERCSGTMAPKWDRCSFRLPLLPGDRFLNHQQLLVNLLPYVVHSTIFWGRACATMVTVFILKDRLDSSQVSSEFIILLLGDVPRVVCQPFWSHRVTDRHKNGELCFAHIVERRLGSLKLPFNDKKSWVGSTAMFVFWVPASISSTVVE